MSTMILETRQTPAVCRLHFGGRLNDMAEYCPPRTVVITDPRVHELYGDRFSVFPTVVTAGGESGKTLAAVEEIYREFLRLGVDRSWFVAAVGGGIVCDIAGFVAATFLRGLPCGYFPTTLLAQADAAVGGKNGVNLDGYKNQVGVFRQPEFLVYDHDVLATLPAEERRNGFAEILKHALIADVELTAFLEEHGTELLALHPEPLAHVLRRSVEIKAAVVARDEREQGERRVLNFGHTLGHALEKVAGLSHGRAVAVGMAAAAALSQRRGLLAEAEVERIRRLLSLYTLPVDPPGAAAPVAAALRHDKKRQDDRIHFVFLAEIGRAVVQPLGLDEITEFLHDLCRA